MTLSRMCCTSESMDALLPKPVAFGGAEAMGASVEDELAIGARPAALALRLLPPLRFPRPVADCGVAAAAVAGAGGWAGPAAGAVTVMGGGAAETDELREGCLR